MLCTIAAAIAQAAARCEWETPFTTRRSTNKMKGSVHNSAEIATSVTKGSTPDFAFAELAVNCSASSHRQPSRTAVVEATCGCEARASCQRVRSLSEVAAASAPVGPAPWAAMRQLSSATAVLWASRAVGISLTRASSGGVERRGNAP
eukprot:scaffold57779_cov30-Tisochrysis_lutea.AAC.3